MSFSPGAWSLYLCTPIRDDLVEFVTACVTGGVGVVQLRDKDHNDRDLLEAAERLTACCRSLGVPFIVNERCDVALAVGADGVHVGQDDLPVRRCRDLLGDSAIIGLSTHATGELASALGEAVSYLSAGPVESARDLVAAAGGPAELQIIQGAGHWLRSDPRMVATLIGWLDRIR